MKRLPLLSVVFACILVSSCGGASGPVADEAPITVEVPVTVVVVVTATPPPATPSPAPSPTAELDERIPVRQDYLHGYEIVERFDKFTSETFVTLQPKPEEAIDGRPGALAVGYSYPEEDPTTPAGVLLRFMSTHDEWEYLDCHSLHFLLDGEKQIAVDTEHDGEVESGYVLESVSALLTLTEFLDIVNSSTVEGRLCRDEFRLTGQQMAALRDLASRMRPE